MRWLYGNLGYKLLAVGVAFLLWGVSHSSKPVQRGFDVPMVLRGVPDDLVIVEQSVTEVNVRVLGSRASLRNISAGELEYPVEVSGAKPGVLSIEVELAALDLPRGAQPVSRSPSTVKLTLAKRGTKTVRVKPDIIGEPAAGFELGEIGLDPPRVRITGAESEVLRLKEVLTETIDITGTSENIVREVRVALSGRNVWLEETSPLTATVQIGQIVEEETAEADADAEETPG
ncbi:MAG: CdaR family protein [Myxococcota bacterium]